MGLALGSDHRLGESHFEDDIVGQIAQNLLVEGLLALQVNILNNLVWVRPT